MNLRHHLLVNCHGFNVRRGILIPMLGLALAGGRMSQADDEASPAQATTASAQQKHEITAHIERYIAQLREESMQLRKDYGSVHPQVEAKKQQLLEAQRTLEFLSGLTDTRPPTSAPASATPPGRADDFFQGGADERDAAKIEELKCRFDQYAAELEKRERQLGMAMQQMQAMQAGRELTPIEGGQLRKFRLADAPAPEVAEKILSLFGARSIRVSIDDRTNSLIVYGKADQMEQIKELLTQIDVPGDSADVDPAARGARSDDARSVLLRVFWLADGLPESEGEPPANYLPGPVLDAMHRLGLDGPRMVAQTVNSLASGKGGSVSFATHVPALLFKQPAQLSCTGEMDPVTGDRTRLQMQINITGNVGCDLSGSLVTPLGHYMVLGTANSIAGVPGLNDPMAMGGMPGGYGGEGGFRGGYGSGEFGRGGGEMAPEMGAEGMAAPEVQKEPKYNTSRFAFVVQVIDGESYAPEGEKERPQR